MYNFHFLDYVGFIKKIMKLMQQDYPMIAKIEVELTQEKEMDHLPNRPSKLDSILILVYLNHRLKFNSYLMLLIILLKWLLQHFNINS